jgi:hypothetical protein
VTGVEAIEHAGQTLAFLIRRDIAPAKTTFVTDGDATLQLGFIVYPAGAAIARHVHREVERRVVGSPECIVVRSGRCEIDIYGDDLDHVAIRELAAGDVVLLLRGGHGFRLLEDTVLLEVRQGPFRPDDKQRF